MVLLTDLLYFMIIQNDHIGVVLVQIKFTKSKLIEYQKLKHNSQKDRIDLQRVCLNRFHNFMREGSDYFASINIGL